MAFKGEHFINDMPYKHNSPINRTFPAAEIHLVLTIRKIILNQRGATRMLHTASHFKFQFTCSCSDIYTNRTDGKLLQQMSEHISKRLAESKTANTNPDRGPGSSIAKRSDNQTQLDPFHVLNIYSTVMTGRF